MALDTSKIIHAPVGGGRYTVTSPIVKEDYGLYLLIEGLELPATYEVDFSNSEHNGTSVTMIGNSDGVLIPNQFIASGKDVFAFLYHVGVDFGRTVYKFRIPNKLRPDRTDEQPTPEEQSVIDQAISALNSAVAQTAQDVIDADASAQSASQSAENAHDSAVDAQNYAESAQTSANNASASALQASASATASANSASQSAQIKTDVQGMVSDAQGYANSASQSATASANSASQASASATSASQSATSAQGYASQAQTSANTASAKASEASTSASTASTKASESAQSASQALTYKTDAESAKTASQTAQGLAEQAQTGAETAQGKAEDAQEAAESAAASVQASAAQIAQNEADILKAFPTDSASGSIASFPDGADDIPLKSLIVNIDPVQDTSSGDPSPENICPISGWTGMQLTVNGTVTPINWQTEAGTVYGGKLDVLSGKLTIDSAKLHKRVGDMNNTDGAPGWKSAGVKDIIGAGFNAQIVGAICSAFPSQFIRANTRMVNDILYLPASGIGKTQTELISSYPDLELDFVIPYATPVTIQLTPHEVNSLLGQNNIFADTGDTEVTYRADPTLYIQRLTEPDADMIADSNIVSGQYFMVGNNLYKATVNIASGAQVIVGTNATRKSLSEALNEINA